MAFWTKNTESSAHSKDLLIEDGLYVAIYAPPPTLELWASSTSETCHSDDYWALYIHRHSDEGRLHYYNGETESTEYKTFSETDLASGAPSSPTGHPSEVVEKKTQLWGPLLGLIQVGLVRDDWDDGLPGTIGDALICWNKWKRYDPTKYDAVKRKRTPERWFVMHVLTRIWVAETVKLVTLKVWERELERLEKACSTLPASGKDGSDDEGSQCALAAKHKLDNFFNIAPARKYYFEPILCVDRPGDLEDEVEAFARNCQARAAAGNEFARPVAQTTSGFLERDWSWFRETDAKVHLPNQPTCEVVWSKDRWEGLSENWDLFGCGWNICWPCPPWEKKYEDSRVLYDDPLDRGPWDIQ